MFGPLLKEKTTPIAAKLSDLTDEYGITRILLKITLWVTGILTIVLLGLQYLWAGLILFIVHHLTIVILENKGQRFSHATLRDYLVITGAMMALLWTAGSHAIPVSFMFWAIMINGITNITIKPPVILVDGFELSLVLLMMVSAPIYIPAIAILTGTACLIGSCASYIQTFKKFD